MKGSIGFLILFHDLTPFEWEREVRARVLFQQQNLASKNYQRLLCGGRRWLVFRVIALVVDPGVAAGGHPKWWNPRLGFWLEWVIPNQWVKIWNYLPRSFAGAPNRVERATAAASTSSWPQSSISHLSPSTPVRGLQISTSKFSEYGRVRMQPLVGLFNRRDLFSW